METQVQTDAIFRSTSSENGKRMMQNRTHVDHLSTSVISVRRSDVSCNLDKLNIEKPTPMKDITMAPPYTRVPLNDDFGRITSPTWTVH